MQAIKSTKTLTLLLLLLALAASGQTNYLPPISCEPEPPDGPTTNIIIDPDYHGLVTIGNLQIQNNSVRYEIPEAVTNTIIITNIIYVPELVFTNCPPMPQWNPQWFFNGSNLSEPCQMPNLNARIP